MKNMSLSINICCTVTVWTGELCMKCERGWELHGGMCYYFSNIEASWQESESKCQYLGGALVKVDSRQEQVSNFAAGSQTTLTYKMNYVADQYWIGLTDLEEEGEWLWVDGSPLSFWQFHEPDNWKVENPDGENCARMGLQDGSCKLKSWFDKSCLCCLKCKRTELRLML
uniref:C-type lectin domain-containing protein n=1 Tax=Mastacembelus armatus TaxID=205130 RepID=A0A7N8YLD4_9TELE